MKDILFQEDSGVFSSKVAGILMHHGKILLQKYVDEDYYSVPSCYVRFGETNEETLRREFKESLGKEIWVNDLKWVSEFFFSAEEVPCHQLCLYYDISLAEEEEEERGTVDSLKQRHGDTTLQFHWIPLNELDRIEGYPESIADLIENYHSGIKHFIIRG